MKNAFVHPTALVETDEVGKGSRIWAYAHIMAGARIGQNCNVGDHCFIESGVSIGDNCTIKNGNMIWEGVTLEDGVFVGPHVFFTNDLYPRSPRLPQAQDRYLDKRNWLVPTLVKRGASLGAAAVVLAGVTIGEYAMLGAGSVVTMDVPPYTLVKGNPARASRRVCRCGQVLRFSRGFATCAECGLRFLEEGEAIRMVNNSGKET